MTPGAGQMSLLDLLRPPEPDAPWGERFEERHRAWLSDVLGLDADGMALFERMVGLFGFEAAWPRSRMIGALNGRRRADGWGMADVGALGLLDASVPTSAVQSRAFAARMGMPKDMVARLLRFDHRWNRDASPRDWRAGAHEFMEIGGDAP